MPPDPADLAARAELVRLAMVRPTRYLAAALAELPDEDLARELHADPEQVWRLRLAGHPRRGQLIADVYRLALLVDADPQALKALLQRVGVLP